MELKLTPMKIVRVLAVCMAVLMALYLLACLPLVFAGRSYPWGFFSFDGEQNLPTMFSTAVLWCSALLVGCIAWAGGGRRSDRLYWIGLAFAFLAAGLDESAMFHERITEGTRQYLDASGLFHFAWVVPYAILMLVFVLIYAPFFFRMPSDTKKHIAFAAVLYCGGALGLEMAGGSWVEAHGKETGYYLLVLIEELLEMSGGIAFVYAFSSHIDRHIPGLCLRISSKP